MSILHTALEHSPPAVTLLAGSGLLDTATEKIANLGTLMRALALVAGAGFVIYQAFSSRGALSRILVSAFAAGVFVWVVFNVSDLQNRVGNEVNSLGTAGSSSPSAVPQVELDAGGLAELAAGRV